MITKIELQNIFGITKKITLNFEIKHLKDSQVNYEQGIIIENDKKVILSPTFIARNASGKTSILRAIEMAYKINSMQDIYNIFLKKYNVALNEMLFLTERHLEAALNIILWRFRFKDDKEKFLIRKIIAGEIEITNKDEQTINLLTEILKKFLQHFNEKIFYTSSQEKISVDRSAEIDLIKNKIEAIFSMQKNKLVNEFKKSLFDSANVFQKNFKLALQENDLPIFIDISFTNQENKIIEIGKHIKFNKNNQEFNDWKESFIDKILTNEWWKGSHKLVVAIIDFLESKTDSLEFKTSSELLKNAFKNFKKDSNRRLHFGHSHIEYQVTKPNNNHPKALFIDDSIIRKILDDAKKNNATIDDDNINFQTNFLTCLVDFYSFEFINKFLCSIDSNISHIEKQKNDQYSILDINPKKGLKNFELLSFGTIKMLFLLYKMSIAFKSNQKNNLILLDEIENGINISLIKFIISLINNPTTNKNNTQILITTHSPSLFSRLIINTQCAFIFNQRFIRLGDDTSLIKRTEDLNKVFIPKNYFNHKFWKKLSIKKGEVADLEIVQTDSIGNSTIFRLLDLFEEINNNNA